MAHAEACAPSDRPVFFENRLGIEMQNVRSIVPHFREVEAATGVEPVMEVLQTSALPLGYAAIRSVILL
jgi:hypothetical protein